MIVRCNRVEANSPQWKNAGYFLVQQSFIFTLCFDEECFPHLTVMPTPPAKQASAGPNHLSALSGFRNPHEKLAALAIMAHQPSAPSILENSSTNSIWAIGSSCGPPSSNGTAKTI